jgi:uncharacterized protein with PIN domain
MIPRLLCDENLTGLARWLRAAGYDTALATPRQPDSELLARSETEDRVLITRDRRLARAAETRVTALLLIGNNADEHALALSRTLGIDWTLSPFTRCLIDNTPLRAAADADLARIPEQSRLLPGPFTKCPNCGRVYWPGSHVRRIREKLRRWSDRAV